MNRGRFQAQGNGLEKSENWSQNTVVYKDDGINLINDLQNQLTNTELNERNIALAKARRFVNNCPDVGITPTKKSYSNNLQNRSIRIDIEVIAGEAFLTLLNTENG